MKQQQAAMLLLGGVGAAGVVAALMKNRAQVGAGAPVVTLPPPPLPPEIPLEYVEEEPELPDVRPPRTSRPRPKPSPSPAPKTSRPSAPKSAPDISIPPSPLTPTIGPPFKPGDEAFNAEVACSRKDLSHPNGRRKKSTQKLEEWLTDLVYWETYPGAPLQISRDPSHRPYVRAWLRIRKHVRGCLGQAESRGASARRSSSSSTRVPEQASAEPASPGARPPRAPSPGTSAPEQSEPASAERQTIGHPFREGDAQHNARLACDQGGLSHPNGRIKRSGQSLADWYTDVAYWETYPDAPATITSSKAHRAYAKAWLELREIVGSYLKTKSSVQGVGAVVGAKRAKPKRSPEPIPNQQPTVAGAGAEARNAAVVLVAKPDAVRHQGQVVRRQRNQKLVDWLTWAAFWVTYPEAPTKLDPKAGREHRNWLRAWVRIKGFIARGLRLLPRLKTVPPLPFLPPKVSETPHAIANWKRWALALSFKSKLRSAPVLRTAYRRAATWLSKDPQGKRFRNARIGKVVGGQRVGMDGLLGEVAQWIAYSDGERAAVLESAGAWPRSLSKAYFATNEIWDRRR